MLYLLDMLDSVADFFQRNFEIVGADNRGGKIADITFADKMCEKFEAAAIGGNKSKIGSVSSIVDVVYAIVGLDVNSVTLGRNILCLLYTSDAADEL